MRISVNVNQVQEVIKKGVKLLPKRCAAPIIENVLITADTTGINILITDLETALRFNIDGTIQEPGEVLLSADTLKLIAKLKNIFTLELTNNSIKAGTKLIKYVNNFDPKDFPTMVKDCTIKGFSVPQNELLNLLEIRYAASIEENRPVFNGVCIDKDHFVSTDTHRLAKREFSFENELEKPVVIKLNAVNLLSSLLDKKSPSIVNSSINQAGNYLQFAFENVTMVTRLIEGNFPNWKVVFPNSHITELTINVKETLEELSFIKDIVKESNYLISFAVDQDNLYFDAENTNNGITLTIPAKVTGETVECMGVNYKFIVDVLEHTTEKEINIKLSGTLSPIVLNNDLVLPVRLMGKRKNSAA